MTLKREWNARQVDSGALSGDVLGEVIRIGSEVIQENAGLTVDGLCGPNTISEIESQIGANQPTGKTAPLRGRPRRRPDLVPVPGKRGIETVYGEFSFKSHPELKGALILDKKFLKNIVKVTFHTGQYTWIHRLIADEFKRLYKEACEVSGYTPSRVWSYVPRRIRWKEDTAPSCHSWGIAVDIDPHLNKWGMKKGTPLHEHPEFVHVFEQAGWTWLGREKYWGKGKGPDPMHFERVRR